MAAELPRVGVVTVHYRDLESTNTLVQSVTRSRQAQIQLIIVNNSPEHSASMAQFVGPNSKVIESGSNIGYSGGLNLGLKAQMRDPNTEWLIVVNNDIRFEPNLIADLVARAHPRQVRSPVLLYEGTEIVQNTGGHISVWLGGTRNLNKRRALTKVQKIAPDFLSGAFMLLHRSVIEDVGYFDESYESYYEDVDFSLRAKQNLVDIGIDWEARAWHVHSASTRDNLKFKTYLIARNQIRFARNWLAGRRRRWFIFNGLSRGLLIGLYRGHLAAFWSGAKCGLTENT